MITLLVFFYAFQPPLKKVICEDLTEENIMSHMPDLSRKKLQEVIGPFEEVDKTNNGKSK